MNICIFIEIFMQENNHVVEQVSAVKKYAQSQISTKYSIQTNVCI